MQRPRSRQAPVPQLDETIREVLTARYRQAVRQIHTPAVSGEIRPDFVARLADGSLLVAEAVRRTATVHDVVRLVGQAHVVESHLVAAARRASPRAGSRRAGGSPRPRAGRTEMLLLAPAFSNEARRTAAVAGVSLHAVPALALAFPDTQRRVPTSRVPLTSEPSWNVVVELIRRRTFPTVRALAAASSTSYAWTHTVASYLEGLGILRRSGRAVELAELQRLLDYVGMERPLRQLRALEVPVAADLPAPELLRSIREIFPQFGPMFLCGFSAASMRGSTLEFPRVLQVYAEVPRDLRNALARASARGGRPADPLLRSTSARQRAEDGVGPARLEVYTPDRDIGRGSSSLSGVRVVSLRQTLLDCAGLGSAGHRAIVELVRAHGNAA